MKNKSSEIGMLNAQARELEDAIARNAAGILET